MAIGDALVLLLVLGFWIFCLFDVITTPESQVRNLDKIWWVLIVLFFNVIGSVTWLVAGRPQTPASAGTPYNGNSGDAYTGGRTGSARGVTGTAQRRLAPDDDPEFLESVRRQNAEDKDLLRRWEDDLRRREDEMRKREDGDGDGDADGPSKPTVE
jgi:hypothetical protein